MLKTLLLSLFLVSCSSFKGTSENAPKTEEKKPVVVKEFGRGELILASELLNKIFDQEMAPISCVQDLEEASLLLRTIQPRLDVVEDDLSAMMDDPEAVDNLIKSCHENCTCGHVDDLLREHVVQLTKAQRSLLNQKKTEKELNRCLNYIQNTFCQSDLYKTLNSEKSDFSFEDSP